MMTTRMSYLKQGKFADLGQVMPEKNRALGDQIRPATPREFSRPVLHM